jgi:hypothetical protein
MMGLFYIVAFVLYLGIATGVVRWARAHAKTNGTSVARWGWGAALVMYLIPFWDWIPTVAMHRYYCATEAGFWVYKTPEQWIQENPGVMEKLVYNKTMPHIQSPYGAATVLNERFIYLHKFEGSLPLNRWRATTEIRDSKNGHVIAREVGFSTSQDRPQAGWSGWKFWLSSERCNTESHRDQGSFDKVTAQLEGAKK